MTMRIPRLFIGQALVAGTEITLHDAPAHYVRNVLRLERGSTLHVFDDSGSEFTAVLETIERRSLRLAVGDALATAGESPLGVHLGIGLARGERMDWTVQKSTELGVATITPLLLARCNAKLDSGRGDNRLRHWRQVAIAACEQSGRSRLPSIEPPLPLEDWLAARADIPGLVLHTVGNGALVADPAPGAVRVLVGPEGGLDPTEFTRACAAGFRPWSLGPRVLRTETAPVAALAILQYLWGDLRA